MSIEDIFLTPSKCTEDLPNSRQILYPADEMSVDRLTRSLLGVCQYKAIQMLNEGSHQMAELINAYTGLYKAYKENKKPGVEQSTTEQVV